MYAASLGCLIYVVVKACHLLVHPSFTLTPSCISSSVKRVRFFPWMYIYIQGKSTVTFTLEDMEMGVRVKDGWTSRWQALYIRPTIPTHNPYSASSAQPCLNPGSKSLAISFTQEMCTFYCIWDICLIFDHSRKWNNLLLPVWHIKWWYRTWVISGDTDYIQDICWFGGKCSKMSSAAICMRDSVVQVSQLCSA